MVQIDQQIRIRITNLYLKNPHDPTLPPLMEKAADLDRKNLGTLKKFIQLKGFPLISTHGLIANRNAWLLAQHADQDLIFQKEILGILERAWETKDTYGPDLAYLKDRVTVNTSRAEGKPEHQSFGT